jgi:anti-sigma regulatory factor (Ser/Thr protein kinase)
VVSRSRSSDLRQFLIRNVARHPRGIARIAAERFGVTPQTVNTHLRALAAEGLVRSSGNTRARQYELVARTAEHTFRLDRDPEEDVVWRDAIVPELTGAPPHVLEICQYGFTEMVNNAIDHSEGTAFTVTMVRTAAHVEFWIHDDGVGIFRKIREALSLPAERDAVLELTKGKFTTDPMRHTGEGIFFSSRLFDTFSILSGEVFFFHLPDDRDWVVEHTAEDRGGTLVQMSIDFATDRTVGEVFDRFAAPDEYAFSMTHVPVALVRHGAENLVSRSQAKRLVRGFDRFEEVVLDFAGLETIGQAFADEIFRVFQSEHPGLKLRWVNAEPGVERMILRARAHSPDPGAASKPD